MPGYSIEYRTHVQNEGWETEWSADGETAGTQGKGLRLEGIQIRLVSNRSDLTDYNSLLSKISKLDESLYTDYSITYLDETVSANTVKDTNTQDEVDSAVEAIQDAYSSLEKLSSYKSYSTAGTFGTSTVTTISSGVIVEKGETTLQNLIIRGDLILDSSASGSITLDNVEVTGDILVRGSLTTLNYDSSEDVNLIFQTFSNGSLTVNSSGDGLLNIYYSEEMSGVVTQATSKSVVLSGSFGEVGFDGTLFKISVSDDSYVDWLTLGDDSEGSTISVSEGATVARMTLYSKTAMTGTGVVTLLEANANNITYTKSPKKVTVGSYVTVDPKLEAILVKSITLTSSSSNLYMGSTVTMTASTSPTDATDDSINWSIINGTGSATISSDGVITPTALGSVTVRATAGDGSGVKAIKTFVIKEPVGGILTSMTTKLPMGTVSPVINITLTGDTFTTEASTVANWTIDSASGLSIRSIVRNSSTSVTVYTTGTAASGTFTLHANEEAMTSGVESEELNIEIYLQEVSLLTIPGIVAPVTGATPSLAGISTDQYTGTIMWYPTASTFQEGVSYTASVVLTPKSGYTFEGVNANSFVVAGASSVTNTANSGVVTVVFPATSLISTDANILSGTLGGATIGGESFTGASTIATSTSLTVAVPAESRTDAILSLTKSNSASTITYGKNTGVVPDNTIYSVNLSTTGTIASLNSGDVIWVKVVAEDGITTRYYKITVVDIVYDLLTVTQPSGVAIATEQTTVEDALTYLNENYSTVTVTSSPSGVTTLPVIWSFTTVDNWDSEFSSDKDAYNVFRWTAVLGDVTNTNSVNTTGVTTVKSTWVHTYDVAFVTNNDQTIETITVEEGNILGEPEGMVKEGSTLDGWYLEETFETKWDFADAISADITLYAKWV
jgi:uncharacterized repeat protein (TIGR02543 family)